MPTLMESGARPCTVCRGRGIVAVPVSCDCSGRCSCGSEDAPCDECEGSGRMACDHCGEPADIRYLGQDLCNPCAPEEEQRFSACSICERPIDVRERRVPLCTSCAATARVAGQQAADATRYERERVA